jgi:hypothetical protein
MLRRNHRRLFGPLEKASFDQDIRMIDASMAEIPTAMAMFSLDPKKTTLITTGMRNDDL